MSNLIEYAKSELSRISMGDDAEGSKAKMRDDILTLLKTFEDQGHSGASAKYVTSVLEKLLRYEPVTPLTGQEDEWDEAYMIAPSSTDLSKQVIRAYQNKRCPRVFKSVYGDGRIEVQDSEGIIFYEEATTKDGTRYTQYFKTKDSFTPVSFPYTPTTKFARMQVNTAVNAVAGR